MRLAALDRDPAYGKRSRVSKLFNSAVVRIILRNGSLLLPSRLNEHRKKEAEMLSETTHRDPYNR